MVSICLFSIPFCYGIIQSAAGWPHNEQNETIVRYLLDDVLDRGESQLGYSLAPDMFDQAKNTIVDPIVDSTSSDPDKRTTLQAKKI